MNEGVMLTHYCVTIQFSNHPDHAEPEILARSAKNAARIALWRLRPEFHRTTTALIVSAPINPPGHFPPYDEQPLVFVRTEGQRDMVAAQLLAERTAPATVCEAA